uniref:Interactor of constitutive active ROPs 1 n=1 Tax=Anthurium amnicola TaxID=1678845 RepID=A0A1D1YUV4_9ARAE
MSGNSITPVDQEMSASNNTGQQQQQQPPPRLSPRAPLHLRTTNSESIGVHTHHRSSPKLEDNHRRSPRSPLPEFASSNQKKRGGRVTDLETKLGHVQEELRKLREQLASAEAAKRDAQQELEETKKLIPTIPAGAGEQVEDDADISAEIQQTTTHVKDGELSPEVSPAEEGSKTQVDSLEVASPDAAMMDLTLEKESDRSNDEMVGEMVKDEAEECSKDHVGEATREEENKEIAVIFEVDEVLPDEESNEVVEMTELEAKLEEKVKELELCLAENANLKKQLMDAEAEAAAARSREEETSLKLTHVSEELAGSRAKADQLGEQLEAAEGASASLEAEMKKLRIQTEQWRKAADAAVAALSVTGGMGTEANGRRAAERCGSMDKHLGMGYGSGGEFGGLGSPLMDDSDDGSAGSGGAKRKGVGIRMFGELWKKRGQPK